MSTDLRQLPQRRHDVELRDRDDESVLVTPSGTTYALNATARAIWELCDGTTTIDELADAISAVFAIDRAAAIDDVTTTIDHLRTADLVTAPKT
jgi:hypothetical protein